MANPFPRLLYRSLLGAVTCALLTVCLPAQIAKRPKKSPGPRALGLVEVLPGNRARFTPVCIMVDGKFFDANDYKATPVPMALESGTVYEATHAGVTQGLFTIGGARQVGEQWFAEGRWKATPTESASSKSDKPVMLPEKKKEDPDPPPVMRRGIPKAEPEKAPAASAPADKPAASAGPKVAVAARAEDTDRPILRRGAPEEDKLIKLAEKDFAAGATFVDTFPAISDTHGAELRPYTFDTKPEERETFQKKMLAFAAEAVRARYTIATPAAQKKNTKVPELAFKNIQLHVFDLSSSNEPTVVLSATPDAQLSTPLGPATNVSVTVIAREDIYGELKKLLAEATDDKHLDIHPRLELVDAVDADGDGVGKLLFRETSDSGKGFVIYRVGLDRLWELFNTFGPS